MHYSERNVELLEPYFTAHMNAMTSEELDRKAAIAAELAFRDKEIEILLGLITRCSNTICSLRCALDRSMAQTDEAIALCKNRG